MIQLLEAVTQKVGPTLDRIALPRLLDLGSCCGVVDYGTRMADYTDAIPCERDAVVALFNDEFDGLALCGDCYRRLQKRGEL